MTNRVRTREGRLNIRTAAPRVGTSPATNLAVKTAALASYACGPTFHILRVASRPSPGGALLCMSRGLRAARILHPGRVGSLLGSLRCLPGVGSPSRLAAEHLREAW